MWIEDILGFLMEGYIESARIITAGSRGLGFENKEKGKKERRRTRRRRRRRRRHTEERN
jgi:hypothetical protein